MNHSCLNNNFSTAKKQKKKNNGNNIIKKIDIKQTVGDFINYYYDKFNNNPNDLATSNILREYSSLKYNGTKYSGRSYFDLLTSFFKDSIMMNPTKVEFTDSGSRRIDISQLELLITIMSTNILPKLSFCHIMTKDGSLKFHTNYCLIF